MTIRLALVHAHDSLRPNQLASDLLNNGRWPTQTGDAPDAILANRIDDADIAMLASSWQMTCARGHEESARKAIEAAYRRGRRTLVFSDHDATRPLDLASNGGIVFRTSMLSSVTYVDEFAKPGFANSIDAEWARLRPWSGVPTVSFVGQTQSAALTAALLGRPADAPHAPHNSAGSGSAIPTPSVARTSLGSPMNVGLVIRRRAIEGLRASSHVRSAIIERDRFFAEFAPHERAGLIAEFHETMANSDYGLCVRGAGNYSYRLYETLAAGRIPIIVDTSMVMPFGDRIGWRQLGLWVALDELDTLGDRVREFHLGLGPDGFAALQREVRRVHARYLSRIGFTRTVFTEDLPLLLGTSAPA